MFDGISRTLGEAARSLQRTDGTALFIAAAVAYYVGQALVREWPRHHAAGQKIGVCVFGGIFVLLFFHTTHDYLAAVIWAALWAVLITGIVWAAGPLLYGAGDLLVFRPLRAITRGVHAMHEHRVAERERRYAEETERLRHAQNQLRRTEARDPDPTAATPRPRPPAAPCAPVRPSLPIPAPHVTRLATRGRRGST